MSARAKGSSPRRLSPSKGKVNRQQKQPQNTQRGPVTKKAKRQAVAGPRQSCGRQGKPAAASTHGNTNKGNGQAGSSSTSQAVTTDTQPSYSSTGIDQCNTKHAQPQPAAQASTATNQQSDPSPLNAYINVQEGGHSQPASLHLADDSASSLSRGPTDPAASSRAAQGQSKALTGPQLQPVLQHGSRGNQLKRVNTSTTVPQQASSPVVDIVGLPSTMAEPQCAENALAIKHMPATQQRSVSASPIPAKALKLQKAAATQPQQQPRAVAAGMRYDCQQLKLLPEDQALHSECMARMQCSSSEPSQALRYVQRAKLADDMAKAAAEDSADAASAHAGCVPARPYCIMHEASRQGAELSKEEAELQHTGEQYDKFDRSVRKLLWLRAVHQFGRHFADSALADRDTFVQVCLMGQRSDSQPGPPTVHQAAQACRQYYSMLQKVYSKSQVLDPYIMDVDALKEYSTSGDLHHFRLLQRRFILYRSSKMAQPQASPGKCPHPSTQSGQPCDADSSHAGQSAPAKAAARASAGESLHDGEAAAEGTAASNSSISVDIIGREVSPDSGTSTKLPDWNKTLQELWRKLQQETAKLTCKQVQDNSEVATAPSCTVTEGAWRNGHCEGHNLPDAHKVWAAIDASLQNKAGSVQRLYFLDGTFPGDLPEGCSSHEDVPGLCCGVDQAVNRMLPPAMRSSRATNFFKHLSVESTGTASFTMFAPIGQVTNVTAFHQETKKRRSWNCGSGDFIVQPVASADNVRKVERVHGAVMGAHKRSHCLLPLEMYLEEGIPLVCYVRDGPCAEMVELPEQSCHCFLSFSNAAAKPPSFKASCNDWHLESELSSAYLLEKLVHSMQEAGVEAGPPEDGADSWVASPYAMLQPCAIQGPDDPRLQGTWQRPWADEVEGQECSSRDIEKQADPANRSSRMEVLLVRSVEKALDAVNGRLRSMTWNAVLSKDDGLKVLQNALPVMVDLQLRALEQPGSRSRRTPKVPGIGDDTGAHFSREYMNQVVQEVHQALRAAGLDSAARQAQGLICNTRGAQSIPSGASADRSSSSVDILACTSSSGPDASLGPHSCCPRLTRRQQLQAQAGVQLDRAQPACSSGTSTQYRSAVSQGSVVSSQRASQEAAGCQVQSGLEHLAAQVCEQKACQPTGPGGPRGTKRVRESGDEEQPAVKRPCHFSPEMLQAVQSDQVFSIFMHIKHAAETSAEGQTAEDQHAAMAKRQNAAASLQEFSAAANAVTAAELLQLGLPVLRAHWLLAMQLEWQASQSAASQFDQLGKAWHHRCWLEALHDSACKGIFQENAESWGAVALDHCIRLNSQVE